MLKKYGKVPFRHEIWLFSIILAEDLLKIKNQMRKISLFIATSLDGYIAKPNDDLSFLKLVEKDGEDYGYTKFIETIDTLIIGRKTYDYVVKEIGSSYYDNGQRDVYVITRTERQNTGRRSEERRVGTECRTRLE